MLKNKKILILFLLSISLNISVNAMEDKENDNGIYEYFEDEDKRMNNEEQEYDNLYSTKGVLKEEKAYGDIDKFFKEKGNDSHNMSIIENYGDYKQDENEKNNSFTEFEKEFEYYASNKNDVSDDNSQSFLKDLNELQPINEEEIESTLDNNKVIQEIKDLIRQTTEISDEFLKNFTNKIKNVVDTSTYDVICIFLKLIPEDFLKKLKSYVESTDFLKCLKDLINKKQDDIIDLKDKEFFEKLNKVIIENENFLEKINQKFNDSLKELQKQMDDQIKNSINYKEKKDSYKEKIYQSLKTKFAIYKDLIIKYNEFAEQFNSVFKEKFDFPTRYENNYFNLNIDNKFNIFNSYLEKVMDEYDKFLEIMTNFQNTINVSYNDLKTNIEKFIEQEKENIILSFKDIQENLNISEKNLKIKNVKSSEGKNIERTYIESDNLSNSLIIYKEIKSLEDIIYNLEKLQNNSYFYKEKNENLPKINYEEEIKYFKKIKNLENIIKKNNNSKISFSADSSKVDSSKINNSNNKGYSKYSKPKSLDKKNLNFISNKSNKKKSFNLSVISNKSISNKSNKIPDSYYKNSKMIFHFNPKNNNNKKYSYDYHHNKLNKNSNKINNSIHKNFKKSSPSKPIKFNSNNYCYIRNFSYQCPFDDSRDEFEDSLQKIINNSSGYDNSNELNNKNSKISNNAHKNSKEAIRSKSKNEDKKNCSCDSAHRLYVQDFGFRDEKMLGLTESMIWRLTKKYGEYRKPSLDLSELPPITKSYSTEYKNIIENQSDSSINKNCMYKIKLIGGSFQIQNNEISEIEETENLIKQIFGFKK